MEGEQATLPFVVPSHLSKLFGLKASVIVEGKRGGGVERKEGVPGANSTCWGDGEAAVGGRTTRARSIFHSLFLRILLCAPPLPPRSFVAHLPEGCGGFASGAERCSDGPGLRRGRQSE